ncbi:MAG: putative murein peptide carboxypeptidase [Chlamydiae bacterium]|nr:putative murein peptide carboxypeptidase [Chlamydiota bacterium]
MLYKITAIIGLFFMSATFGSIKPLPLSRGDTIALVAPASWCEGVEETIAALEERGFHVKLASNVGKRVSNFAGSDEERALAFMECWEDPEVSAVWCLRGGYGSGRILDLLDYERFAENPKIFIGMSDITALHVALGKYSDLITFLGPVATSLVNEKELTSFAEAELWETLSSYEKEWAYGKTLVPGRAIGRLTGGNLSLLVSHVGTPWEVETKGKILVLEDVGEYAYRIDRSLLQLKQAGLFDEVAGVILGSWKRCEPSKEGVWDVDQVVREFFKDAPYPVLMDFPTGHIKGQVTLPLNCLVELDASEKKLTLLESVVASGVSP